VVWPQNHYDGFLVWPQNQGQRFGASKSLRRFHDLSLKTKVDSLVIWASKSL
jgi:hypothetical protein